MTNLDPEQRRTRAAAHAEAARSDATICPNWPHPIEPKKRKSKKTFEGKTPRFRVAQGFKAGHGLYS